MKTSHTISSAGLTSPGKGRKKGLPFIGLRAACSIVVCSLLTFSSCKNMAIEKAVELNNKGLRLMSEGKNKEARGHFIQATTSEALDITQRTHILRNIAISYSNENVMDSAKHFYSEAAQLNAPNSIDYLINMADVYVLENKSNSALQMLLKAYQLDSTQLAINNSLGLLYLGENSSTTLDPTKALKYNKKANDINSNPSTRFVLAKNYFLLKSYQAADSLFTSLYEAEDSPVDYLLGAIYNNEAAGNVEKTKELVALLQKRNPEVFEKYKQEREELIKQLENSK